MANHGLAATVARWINEAIAPNVAPRNGRPLVEHALANAPSCSAAAVRIAKQTSKRDHMVSWRSIEDQEPAPKARLPRKGNEPCCVNRSK